VGGSSLLSPCVQKRGALSEAPLPCPKSAVASGPKHVAARRLRPRLSRCQLAIALHSGSLVAVPEPQLDQLTTARVAVELASPPPSCLGKRHTPTRAPSRCRHLRLPVTSKCRRRAQSSARPWAVPAALRCAAPPLPVELQCRAEPALLLQGRGPPLLHPVLAHPEPQSKPSPKEVHRCPR
jgi:hypothetical protein